MENGACNHGSPSTKTVQALQFTSLVFFFSLFNSKKRLTFLSSGSSIDVQHFSQPLLPANLPLNSLHLLSTLSLVASLASFTCLILDSTLQIFLFSLTHSFRWTDTHTHICAHPCLQAWPCTHTSSAHPPQQSVSQRAAGEWRAEWYLISVTDVLINVAENRQIQFRRPVHTHKSTGRFSFRQPHNYCTYICK